MIVPPIEIEYFDPDDLDDFDPDSWNSLYTMSEDDKARVMLSRNKKLQAYPGQDAIDIV